MNLAQQGKISTSKKISTFKKFQPLKNFRPLKIWDTEKGRHNSKLAQQNGQTWVSIQLIKSNYKDL